MALFSQTTKKEKESREAIVLKLNESAVKRFEDLCRAQAETATQVARDMIFNLIHDNKVQHEFKRFLEKDYPFHTMTRAEEPISNNKGMQLSTELLQQWKELFTVFEIYDRSKFFRALIYFYHSKLKNQDSDDILEKYIQHMQKLGVNVLNSGFIDKDTAYITVKVEKI